MRKNDGFTPTYRSELVLTSAQDAGTTPTLWALPGLLPCHHLSAIVGTTGVGLTQLAVQVCAHLAPNPTPHLLPDLRPSLPDPTDFRSQISYLKSLISEPPIVPLGSSDPEPNAPEPRADDEHPNPPLQPDVHPEPVLPAVLLIAGREAPETLRARLAAAGTDLRRILILTEVTDTACDDQITRPLKASDHRLIGETLHQYRSIRLVIIDNAEDLFFDTNRINKNRLLRQLACFRALAESREVNVTLLANIPRLENDPFRSTLLSTLHEVCRTIHLLAPDLPTPGPDLQSPISGSQSQIPGSPSLSTVHSSSLHLQEHPRPPKPHPPPESLPVRRSLSQSLFHLHSSLFPLCPSPHLSAIPDRRTHLAPAQRAQACETRLRLSGPHRTA